MDSLQGRENVHNAGEGLVQLTELGDAQILGLRLNLAGDGRADGGELVAAGRHQHNVDDAAVVLVVLAVVFFILNRRSWKAEAAMNKMQEKDDEKDNF